MTRVHTEAFPPRRVQQGFTLIELMIVVAVVALLAAVAIPSYRSHVIKTNRSAAESFMHQIANKEEQVLLDMRNYVQVANTAAFPTPPMTGLNMSVPADVASNYKLSVAASAPLGAPVYIIYAEPINPPQNDPVCQMLTLDSTGAKGIAPPPGGTAPTGSPQLCW